MKASYLIIIAILFLYACDGNPKQREIEIKKDQYAIEGKNLYLSHCSMCHQKDGEGLAQLYPPLNRSDFMEDNFEEVICLIKNGRTTSVVVNGITYTQPMPATRLTNLEIAQVATYIYNTWEHDKGLVEVKEVDKILEDCKDN